MAVALLSTVLAPAVSAQAEPASGEDLYFEDDAEEEIPAAEPDAGLRPRFNWALEAKAHYRDSEDVRIAVPFPFSADMLPPGAEQGLAATVNPGTHLEISTVTLLLDAEWSPALAAHAKLDFIDLYDRNPTSSDRELDVDEAWLRFGRETGPALLPLDPGAYLKVGKFPKFERQDDRHLESYGLVSTTFNRFEDMGLELGVDLGKYLYLKGSLTQGNPVFLRDPNALAGDNGIPEQSGTNPDPELGTGLTLIYDAEVEDLDADGEFEVGAGAGFRWADVAGVNGVDLLLFGYERDLADTVELEGSFYGGDLDLLRGPANRFPFPIEGREKTEVGANLWLYLGGFSLFGQYVDQDLAGLGRTGAEAELAWSFDLPLVAATGGRQLFPAIAPAVRYSTLDADFAAPAVTPAPTFAWDWERLDVGVRATLVAGIDLTVEYAFNDFTKGSGETGSIDELLVTLRWRS